jgi:hypothetical protein
MRWLVLSTVAGSRCAGTMRDFLGEVVWLVHGFIDAA